jgi:hypothetical protein
LASLIVAIVIELIEYRNSRFHVSAKLKSLRSYSSYTEGNVGIQVTYKSQLVESSIAVLHIALVNDGKKDIMFSAHFSEDIVIRANGGSRIIAASVERNAICPAVSLNADGSVSLSWEILKVGEEIDLELVICPASNTEEKLNALRCFNLLGFEVRSDCLEKIVPEREESQKEQDMYRRRNHMKVMLSMMWMVSFLMMLYGMMFSMRYNVIVNGEIIEDAAVLFSSPIGKYIISPNHGKTVYADPSEFEKGSLTVSSPDKKLQVLNSITVILSVVIFLSSIVFYIIMNIVYRRRRRTLAER